jgi:glyceraldehyde-3-phosphate dehydrogenase (NADP+)
MNNITIIQTKNYINGAFVSAKEYLDVYDKYSQKLLAKVSMANENDIEETIQSAYNAFAVFKQYSAEKRAGILQSLYEQLNTLSEEFAQLIAAEGGKPISYARSEVSRALDNIQTGIRETLNFTGEQVPMDYLNGKNKTAYTIRQPLGVVLGITPFNFPLNLALHKLIPAIAVGAPIILKPAPQAPLTLLALANLLQNTELPKAAVNIIMTDNANAQKLVEDDRIKILSFTGSDKVGWMLKAISGKKKVLLEMGGNAAAIIDSSANLQRAARKLVYGSFLNAGQICISTQRIYVLENVYEQFMQYFIEETQKVQSGDMRNENVINSSMISASDVERIQQWIDEAAEQGAEILTGGKILDAKANIFEPTILTNTNISMKVNAEEAFAPVVIIEKVSGFEQAVDLVNESKYGLQAGVFTDSLQNMLKAQTDLDVGGVIVNDVPGFRIDAMPYGGIKDSGVGREGAKYVMQEFTEPKLIVLS